MEKCDFRASKQDPIRSKNRLICYSTAKWSIPRMGNLWNKGGISKFRSFSFFWLGLRGEKMVGIFSRFSKSGLRRSQSTLVSNNFYLQRSVCKSPRYLVRFLFLIWPSHFFFFFLSLEPFSLVLNYGSVVFSTLLVKWLNFHGFLCDSFVEFMRFFEWVLPFSFFLFKGSFGLWRK